MRIREESVCSDACKQAALRDRVGRGELNRRGKEAETRRIRAERVRRYHAELHRIGALAPLPSERALPLLRELAGVAPWDQTAPARLYGAAVVAWHPDEPSGGHQVFQLLQTVYRSVNVLAGAHA
ncbi:hypothetical protein GCM10010129_57290 [Streptomyces fumigatiscleroticus]|nr:hypothetical protein GCM10010129_57290 [Streptomyces fumigatiscleroticus]